MEGCPHGPNSKKAEPGAPQSQHRQGAQLWGNGGPQALRGKARGPPPSAQCQGASIHPARRGPIKARCASNEKC